MYLTVNLDSHCLEHIHLYFASNLISLTDGQKVINSIVPKPKKVLVTI